MEKGKNMGKKVQGKKSARYARDAQKAKDARGGKSAAAAGKGKDRNIGNVIKDSKFITDKIYFIEIFTSLEFYSR